MTHTTYNQVKTEIARLENLGSYKEILQVVEEALQTLPADDFHKHQFDLMFKKAYHFTNLQMYPECFQSMRELLEQGFSCPLDWKRFEPLQQFPHYEELSTRNAALVAEAQANQKYNYVIHLPEGYTARQRYPLFFALHGDGGNIEELSEYWQPDVFLQRGFIFVYVQSSQVYFHNHYAWLKNPVIARHDVKDCYDHVVSRYAIDTEQVYVGGFSGGAITSIDLVLTNPLPARGFIALCPILKPVSFSTENVIAATARGARGVFMEGEQALPVANEEEMLNTFIEVGFPHHFYINPGVGHGAPANFSAKLEEALRFLMD